MDWLHWDRGVKGTGYTGTEELKGLVTLGLCGGHFWVSVVFSLVWMLSCINRAAVQLESVPAAAPSVSKHVHSVRHCCLFISSCRLFRFALQP